MCRPCRCDSVTTVTSDPGHSPARVRRPWHLGVGVKFLLTTALLVPAIFTLALIAAHGLQHMHDSATTLAGARLKTVLDTSNLVSAASRLHETALMQVAADTAGVDAAVNAGLDQTLLPQFETAVAVLRQDYDGDTVGQARVDLIHDALQPYLRLRHQRIAAIGAATTPGRRPVLNASDRTDLTQRIDGIFSAIVTDGEKLRDEAAARARQTGLEADRTYSSTLVNLAVGVLVVFTLSLSAVAAMIRNVLPRIRSYSTFAARVAAGQPTSRLRPRGFDELSELGRALNAMVDQRAATTDSESAQSEFVDTMQVTGTEDEAHELLQRHLQRCLPEAEVVVLRRNNSANRLEAATGLPSDSPIGGRLLGAEPRSCAALRIGKTHREGTGRAPLLSCTLCGHDDRPSTCEPLLVSGEVIGSVLVTHPPLPAGEQDDHQRSDALLKNTVSQAAPMLANLRNLALAEFRANNDALTGLPNKRATDDTLKRMVAQANRSISPLTAIMLDLDHFKQINDRFGHGKGDEVLAAVGTVIRECLRSSDFAGRFGGEEFLVLLPDTPSSAAMQLAERIRASVAAITVVGVERDITASLGIADLLEHAGSADGLIHEADRALYAAKAQGRNRVATAPSSAGPVPVVATVSPSGDDSSL